MGRKGKLAVFESSNISKTGDVTSNKIGVCVYATSTSICMIFLSQFRSIKIFDDHGL